LMFFNIHIIPKIAKPLIILGRIKMKNNSNGLSYSPRRYLGTFAGSTRFSRIQATLR